MHDPRQPEMAFQGRDLPREGDQNRILPKELKLGDLCLAVGNLTDALAYYKAALAGAPEEDRETRLEILLKASACLRRQGKSEDALALLEGLIPSFEGRGRRDLLAEKATLLCLVGRYGEAGDICEMVQREESASERGKDAGVYLVLGHVLSRLCKWKQAIACLEHAATFARMSGDASALGNALNNLGIVYKNLCRFDDSARLLRRAVRVARRTRDDASLSVRLLNLATTLFKQGEIQEADSAVSECIKISALLSLRRTQSLATICRARIEKVRGRFGEAVSLLKRVIAEAQSLDEPRVGLLAEETLGEVLCEQGDLSQARRVLEECLGKVPEHAKDLEAEIKCRLAEVYLALGTKDRARCCGTEALKVAESTGDLYEAARCLRVLAGTAATPADAAKLLSKADHTFAQMGARLERALTLEARAALAGVCESTRAKTVEEAISVLEICCAHGSLTRALCLAASIYLDEGRDHDAMMSLKKAEDLAGESTLKRAVSQVRVKLDRRLSEKLVWPAEAGLATAQEAFAFLRTRLGATGLILGKPSEDGPPEVVTALGIDPETAVGLLKAVSARGPGPVVSTNVTDLAPTLGARPALRSLLGVSFGAGASDALCLTCWPSGGKPGLHSEISYLVEAYYEILRLAPVLERAMLPGRECVVPICLGGILTADRRLKEILLSLAKIARTRANVLVTGETGTGKELVARVIHALSPRKREPFVVQNCAALPESLLESELFGYRQGAFTDARTEKRGLLETASGGTFFLDEIGDISASTQAKMLRAIESGEIRRLGDTVARPVDVRFISATNKLLEQEVERGQFRRDLYYRLNVVALALPPLRDRRGDIALLARLFLKRLEGRGRKCSLRIDPGAMRALANYTWPGNVRQLENEIQRAVAILGSDDVVGVGSLSPSVTGHGIGGQVTTLKDEVRLVERSRILSVLERCAWNKTHAAKMLGDLSRPALIGKMKRLGIPLARPDAQGQRLSPLGG